MDTPAIMFSARAVKPSKLMGHSTGLIVSSITLGYSIV
jgi:hypothetical protein